MVGRVRWVKNKKLRKKSKKEKEKRRKKINLKRGGGMIEMHNIYPCKTVYNKKRSTFTVLGTVNISAFFTSILHTK